MDTFYYDKVMLRQQVTSHCKMLLPGSIPQASLLPAAFAVAEP